MNREQGISLPSEEHSSLRIFIEEFYRFTSMAVNASKKTVIVDARGLLELRDIFTVLTGRKLVEDPRSEVYFQADNGAETIADVNTIRMMLREINSSRPNIC